MARGGSRNGTTHSYYVMSQQGYLRRASARDRRALVTGRRNCYPRMEYQIHPPLLQLFGCQELS